jgi:plastocyanin
MQKFICFIVVFLALVTFYSPCIQAQKTDTVNLSVSARRISADPLTVKLNVGDNIIFETDQSYTFTIMIDNYDHFFDNPATQIIFNVSAENPVRLPVDSPPDNDTLKVYSVGIVVTNPHTPIPLPPASPPRIILNSE